jgi:sugar (pentulose or hexulose) kinase
MKVLAAILLGGALMAAPALAQDNAAGPKDDMAKKAEMHHEARHHERYKRDYKTDQEEHQATEDLNKQYRGVNAADVH